MPAPKATAPYQFVSADAPIGFPDTMPSVGGLSGQISIKLTALEPILVCGAQANGQDREFLKVNGRHCIPGSSLKGVIRTIVEAMSLSELRQTASRRMFYRDLASEKYLEAFVRKEVHQPVDYLSRAGYLKRSTNGWEITECDWAKIEEGLLAKQTNFRLKQRNPIDRIREVLESSLKSGLECKLPEIATYNHHPKGRNPSLQLRYRLVEQVTVGGRCRLVVAGWMPNRHYEAIFFPPAEGAPELKVSTECWDDFDAWLDTRKERRERFNTLHRNTGPKDAYPDGIPVFWIPNLQGGVRAFGFSQLFSLPYKQQVTQLIFHPDPHDVLSFADSMFGCVSRKGEAPRSRRGRVQFCAAWATGAMVNALPAKRVIPGNPSATCIGMYLVQPALAQIHRKGSSHGLNTYDNPQAALRGRKFYWHRRGAWQSEPPAAVGGEVASNYAPLPAKVVFEGKIAFERLTEIELGALLESLVLPVGHAHKIGLGKSFGLGSVRIDVTQFEATSNALRYRSLRGRNKSSLSIDDVESLKGKFKISVAQHAEVDAFEGVPEIKALRKLTDYNNSPPVAATQFMPLQRPHPKDDYSAVYANKPVLPPIDRAPF